MRVRFCAMLTVTVLAVPMSAAADTIHVPGDYPTIQEAIDAASDGDEVVVADGTWSGPGNIDLDLDGKLLTVRSESGDPATCTIDCALGDRAFVFLDQEPAGTTVAGFSIVRGRGFNGGAVYVGSGSRIIFRDCVFNENETTGYGGGGAIYNLGWTTIEGCRFEENVACGGSAIRSDLRLEVSDSVFVRNFVSIKCGGGTIAASVSVSLSTSVFESNSALFGGAVSLHDADATVTNCRFVRNYADSGGAVFAGIGSLEMTGCVFERNESCFRGASLFLDRGQQVITDCTFFGNSTCDDFGEGGGIHVRGSEPTVAGCTFRRNFGGRGGGGIRVESGSAHVSDTMFCENLPDAIMGVWTDDGDNDFLDECPCAGDLDISGDVDFDDLLIMLAVWGPYYCDPDRFGYRVEDIDRNCDVGFTDLLVLLASWGSCE